MRVSVVNGIDACIALKKLQRCELVLRNTIGDKSFDHHFHQKELSFLLSIVQKWCFFAYPEQFPDKKTKKRTRRLSPQPRKLNDCLIPTRNRINSALKGLKKSGIRAKIHTDKVEWNNKTALWITYDVEHPIASLLSTERVRHTLIKAFTPDHHKVVRQSAIRYYWETIILIPLVVGKSIENQAYPNMSSVAYSMQEMIDTNNHFWHFIPEYIEKETWSQLGLPSWQSQPCWEIFNQFSMAYNILHQHIEHIADFSRLPDTDLEHAGETVLKRYLTEEEQLIQPYLQEAYDSAVLILAEFPENLSLETLENRPNIIECMNYMIEFKDILLPIEDHDEKSTLSLDQVVAWRDRLNAGLNLLGLARYYWIADSLEFKAYDID